MEIWITPPGKETLPTRVLAEGKGSTEWVVGKPMGSDCRYQLWLWEQTQKRRLLLPGVSYFAKNMCVCVSMHMKHPCFLFSFGTLHGNVRWTDVMPLYLRLGNFTWWYLSYGLLRRRVKLLRRYTPLSGEGSVCICSYTGQFCRARWNRNSAVVFI